MRNTSDTTVAKFFSKFHGHSSQMLLIGLEIRNMLLIY